MMIVTYTGTYDWNLFYEITYSILMIVCLLV